MTCFVIASCGLRLRVARLGALVSLLLTAAAPFQASAQQAELEPAAGDEQRVAAARALFDEGLKRVDAEQWSLAADCFSRLLKLRYSAVAAYNLALAHVRLGETVRALARLRELLAQPGLEPKVREAAQALAREAERNVGQLKVRVHGECAACSVQVDGKLWPGGVGLPAEVDPGHHSLALVRDSEVIATSDITVAPGARLSALLQANAASAGVELPVASAPSVPSGALGEGAPPPAHSGSLLASPWFWGGVGVLAASAVTLGVVLGSGGTQAASPVPGNFMPAVLTGTVK